MTYNILKSRTFWTTIFIIAYNTLIQIPAGTEQLVYLNYAINFVGMVLITYFHVNPSQKYNAAPGQQPANN